MTMTLIQTILSISFILVIFQQPCPSRQSSLNTEECGVLLVRGDDNNVHATIQENEPHVTGSSSSRTTIDDIPNDDFIPINEGLDKTSNFESRSFNSRGVDHGSKKDNDSDDNEESNQIEENNDINIAGTNNVNDNVDDRYVGASLDEQQHQQHEENISEDDKNHEDPENTIFVDQFRADEPFVESGLLVLDHENLLYAMMGKSFDRNNRMNATNDIHHNPSATTATSSSPFQSKLLLLAFYEPWCQKSLDLIVKLEDASDLLNEKFSTSSSLQFASEKNIPMPLFGKMDTSAFEDEDLVDFFTLLDNAHNGLPVLKFVLIEHHDDEYAHDLENEVSGDNDDDADDIDYNINNNHYDNVEGEDINQNGTDRTIIDFLGDSETAEDIVETVIHYWYRFVVSDIVSYETLELESGLFSEDSKNDDNSEDDLENTNNDGHEPIRPIFVLPDLPSILSFVQSHKNLFHPTTQVLTGVSDREETYVHELLTTESGNDPYLVFVQCRNHKEARIPDDVVDLYQQFNDLAHTFTYRRDIAFFTVTEEDCHWITDGSYFDADTGYKWNGYVRVIKLYPSRENIQNQNWWQLGETFPSLRSSISEVLSSMTQYAVVESTPSILWFDKGTNSALAFPMYRKVHLVLFIDMHTPRLKDGSFNYTSIAYEQSKYAISCLHESALYHRLNRPAHDVVFLIVPSTETQILTTFGIDIWSSMDLECTGSDLRHCHPDNIPMLPMAMITSRRESNSTMLRYYLNTDELLDQGNKRGNTINQFLLNYFMGNLSHHVQSEENYSEKTLSSGVTILNGNNFDELVMKSKKHSIVQFTAPYCGHCKRFNVIWDELAILIKEFRWDTILDVMTIDVTKNDVIHEMIDVQNVPSVFFFPSNKKDNPVELLIKGKTKEGDPSNIGEISSASLILEWMIDLNVFDEKELLDLVEKGVSSNL